MIINWTESRLKVVPVKGKGNIILQPGNNEVDESLWNECRGILTRDIKAGRVKEVHVKKEEKIIEPEKKGPGGKILKPAEKVTTVKGKGLKDLSLEEAEAVVNETFALDTLKKWKKTESRDSIRTAIMNQIETVEKFGENKKEDKDK